jgi:hypothetical protein
MVFPFAVITGISPDGQPEKKSSNQRPPVNTRTKLRLTFWAVINLSFEFGKTTIVI